jgi:hypothetical protein
MKVKSTYPRISKQKLRLVELRYWVRWPFSFAVYMCPIVNLIVGGKAWSVVVLWALWILWTLVFSPSLVEYNRISQFVKFVAYGSILLILIDVLLSPGWAREIVTLVFFGGLIITGVLFFTDLEKQKQNMMPMLWMIFISFLGVIASLIFWIKESGWPLIVMAAIAIALLIASIAVLRRGFIRELKKRFHTK